MKYLVWVTLVVGFSAHANQSFNCGGDGDYVLKDIVTVTGNDKVFITEYTSTDKDRREMVFVEKAHGDYIYEKQVTTVRLKKSDDGLAFDVRLIVDGEKPRPCSNNN